MTPPRDLANAIDTDGRQILNRWLIAAVLLCSIAATATKAADNPDNALCQSLTAALLDALKRAAAIDAEGFFSDNSAVQKGVRATMVNSELLQAQLNIAQLSSA